MQLRGQAHLEGPGEKGYAMVVLLIGLGVMAILMTVLMPVWKHDAQREKEAELVFRGEQYGRALSLFQRKHGPGTTPPTVDALLQDHVLRKKYKDPITNADFDVIMQSQNTQPGQTGQRGAAPTPQAGFTSSPSGAQSGQRGAPAGGAPVGGGVGGIFGFASKSKAESIRIYKGRSHYNEWVFTAPTLAQGPGGGPGGVPGVGSGRGRGGQPGPGGLPGGGLQGTTPLGGPGRGVGPGGRGITISPNGQIIDQNTGQPVINPRTGQPLTLPPGLRGRGPGG